MIALIRARISTTPNKSKKKTPIISINPCAPTRRNIIQKPVITIARNSSRSDHSRTFSGRCSVRHILSSPVRPHAGRLQACVAISMRSRNFKGPKSATSRGCLPDCCISPSFFFFSLSLLSENIPFIRDHDFPQPHTNRLAGSGSAARTNGYVPESTNFVTFFSPSCFPASPSPKVYSFLRVKHAVIGSREKP